MPKMIDDETFQQHVSQAEKFVSEAEDYIKRGDTYTVQQIRNSCFEKARQFITMAKDKVALAKLYFKEENVPP